MNGMSWFQRKRRFRPIVSMILSESGCRGRSEMSSFHGLSFGKIWRVERIASASGVLNRIGFGFVGAGAFAAAGGGTGAGRPAFPCPDCRHAGARPARSARRFS
jgi:hypothetical protein